MQLSKERALVETVRHASREMVRELGFLNERLEGTAVSHSECHALIEIDRLGSLSVTQLSALLRLDKSTTSRVAGALARRRLVAVAADAADGRSRGLRLTGRGRALVRGIHQGARDRVAAALVQLSAEERGVVERGLRLYAQGLRRSRLLEDIVLRPIRRSDDPALARVIRKVMPEFGADGPGFAIHDPEVDGMFEAYRGSRSAYLVAERAGRVLGGVGVGPLAGGPADVCELRKMYLLPEARGFGLGEVLLTRALEAARGRGFRRCYLETLRTMTQAKRLYQRFGFKKSREPMGDTGHFGCDTWYVRELA